MDRCQHCNGFLDETPNTKKIYCPECDGPPVEDPVVAIAYVLSRVQTDPNFWHYMIGTEGFARLCKIEAKLCGLPYRQVRKERETVKFRPGRCHADIRVERARRDLIRRATRDGDDDRAIIEKIEELLDAPDEEVIRLHHNSERGALVV